MIREESAARLTAACDFTSNSVWSAIDTGNRSGKGNITVRESVTQPAISFRVATSLQDADLHRLLPNE